MRKAISTLICAVLAAAPAASADQTSENYRIRWDVADAGGGTMMSANYVLIDSVGQTAVGEGFSTNYILAAGFQTPPDSDADLVKNFMDNCIEVMNTDQLDTNSDGFGNVCDPDLNDDLTINFIDLGQMKAVFFSNDADADLNGDGTVNFIDLGIMKAAFFGSPGPSGIAP